MKLLCSAFDATLKKFGIKGLTLAEEADVTSSMISNFRHDASAITTDSLEKMLASLSDDAFSYWISQLIHYRGLEQLVESPVALNALVEQLDEAATAELLQALANKLRAEAEQKR